MGPFECMRRELLRLAASKRHAISVNTRRVSALYNISEKAVRRELIKLAQQKLICIAEWDGRQVRPLEAWSNAEEFVESKSGEGLVLVNHHWDRQ
jgi:DNA-binding GntR family transcriptional regulator